MQQDTQQWAFKRDLAEGSRWSWSSYIATHFCYYAFSSLNIHVQNYVWKKQPGLVTLF